jgi:hypothetical protein
MVYFRVFPLLSCVGTQLGLGWHPFEATYQVLKDSLYQNSVDIAYRPEDLTHNPEGIRG